MKAFVVTGAHEGGVQEVPDPVAGEGEVIVDIHRVGVCGTDVEFWTGEMAYLHQGHARYPIRLGHEWCGVVSAAGAGVDATWLGRRVTGDTMIGCGLCYRCRSGRHHVCEDRFELGVRGGFPGALAEQLAVPATALFALPDGVDDAAGAMIEPGGNALRSVWGAALSAGDRLLVLGTGTMGLLAAEFARADGVEVHLMGRSPQSIEFARTLGFAGTWLRDRAARPALGCGHRRLERGGAAGARARPGRARQARGLPRSVRHSQPHRHSHDGAQGRDRCRHSRSIPGDRRRHRALRGG
jgi:threonine dehydrogenase-like Zn-dependent dehydrogenase